MITCPECTQTNPPENRFCQHCGASLLVSCHYCGAEVKVQDVQCGTCGGWLQPSLIALVVAGDPEVLQKSTYVDAQQRYQLLVTSTEQPLVLSRMLVVDTQPEEPSYLEQILAQEADNLQKLEKTEKETLSNPQLWIQMGIPAIARYYLILRESSTMFPLIHDAWISPDHEIILLENRQTLIDLTQYIRDNIPLYEQVLQWCFQMAKAWHELAPLACCQTLLNLENLYLDEDDNLAVQQLISDDPDNPPTIQALVTLWQIMFDLAHQPTLRPLKELVEEYQYQSGESQEIAALQQALRQLVSGGRRGVTTVIQGATVGTVENAAMPDSPSEAEDDWANRPEFTEQEGSEVQAEATEVNLDRMSYAGEGDELPTVVLPMHLLSLDDAGMTDIGSQRDHNEDYFGMQTRIEKLENLLGKQVQGRGFYIVCDGMGGHAAGEVASALSVETIQVFLQKQWQDKLPDEAMIRDAIWKTNQTIYDINLKNARSGSGRMGTTLVMLLVHNNQAAIAHVGDSRIYRISRKWNLEQLTVDHEVGQREIQKGVEPEIAYGRADAYQLTQAIGPRDNTFVNPDVHFIDINEDCLFLLCSDGLSDNNLIEESWEEYLLPLLSSRANLDQGVKDLIELANEHNGHDNITAVLVRVRVRPNLGESASITGQSWEESFAEG